MYLVTQKNINASIGVYITTCYMIYITSKDQVFDL